MSALRRFILRDLRSVKGYLDPADAFLFLSVLEGQSQGKKSGGLAEIGVYYGRSFFLLRKMAKDGEQVLGIDTFDIGGMEDGLPVQMRAFMAYGKKIGMAVDREQIICGDSTKLLPESVLSKVGPVRFFSIDGGHLLGHVRADSVLARDSLAEFGVIAFDDSFNPEWPEVTIGIIDFLRANEDTHSVFCITDKKTYVCKRSFLDFYKGMVRSSPHLRPFEISNVEILGTPAVRVHHQIKRRIAYEVMIRAGAGALSGWA